jgi:hypothetical protein
MYLYFIKIPSLELGNANSKILVQFRKSRNLGVKSIVALNQLDLAEGFNAKIN